MNKFIKKLLSVGLVTAMVLGCAVGCGSSSSSSTDADDEDSDLEDLVDFDSDPITITIFSELANYSGEQVGWSAEVMLEKFNVILYIVQEQDGVLETRMESGDLGDIVIWGSDGTNYTNAITAGLLYDWYEDDLVIEYGSYIYENMQAALAKNSQTTSKATDGADDTVYGFGHNVATSSADHESFFYTWDIRWDLYAELGYPEVNDLDDLIEVFEAMQEICPTDENGNKTYAASLWPDWDGSMVMYVKALATAYYGYDELGVGLYDPADGTFYGCLDEDGPYVEMLRFFNKLYQKGLLDPDSMTQTYDEMYAKVQAGGTFWSIFNYAGSAGYNTEEHTSENKMMLSLVPTEASPIVYGMSTYGGNRIWSIGANTEYPELCMAIINYFCTPEGCMTYNYGPQGLCWDYDDDGYAYLTEFGYTCYYDRSTAMSEEWGGSTFNDGCFQFNNTTWSTDATNGDSLVGESYNVETWASYASEAACDTEQDWRDYFGVTSTEEYMETTDYSLSPASTYSESTKDSDFKTTWSAVTTEIVKYSWQCIYASSDAEFESLLQEMISAAEAYGYQECYDWCVSEAAERYALEVEALSYDN